ncbi:acyltransferase [Acinetobacter baumannii]|uniref:Atr16 n=1 Tax=Acinetobacter baumannii TaxID=470 RepID=V5RAM9_ACIBA|nr:Atr16 [Acinetobacter baumannii]MDC4558650.1 acyltransferase [Acinetobacter baumannii]
MLILKFMKLFSIFFTSFRTLFYSSIFRTKIKKIGVNVTFDINGKIDLGKNLVIESGATIIVEKGAKLQIGDNTFIGENTYIKCYGGSIQIGNNVSINSKCFLNGAGGLLIGNNTRIGTQSIMISSNHIFERSDVLIKDQGTSREGITIGQDVWFGARVTVLDGTFIVDRVVVGACSLINKSILENGVFVGIPARKVKEI